ncbi:MAG: insulinase family protein [Eubacterium sp.]|nr:insulinase family protein [Eubacterium sp.]
MYDAYRLIKQERIEDVHADAIYLEHKKTGARVALLSNKDNNKVFTIGFRTPPENSTGVAHIIEHTVLCGSRKFPVKDPFVELAKGSLNTFLNAMTYPDKTIYPVASCNDADFHNLMDVYLDAVFYPNIYSNEKIFRQEGWHYELDKPEGELKYNGVVYNEMKGAFSSAEEVLDRAVFNTLFPDTPYGVESGGDPQVIPELTYDEFLNFHRKYYHPSNSYIYLYGDMDMDAQLDWIDQEYLSRFDRIQVNSEIPIQKPFAEEKEVFLNYPILDDEPLEKNTYLTESFVVGDAEDVTLDVAFSVLSYVLLDSPGAPVKQALLDAGIGEDVEGSFADGTLQPFFTIESKNAESAQLGEFKRVIRDTLTEIADKRIDRKAIMSGINFFEFRFREADYAQFPKGLIYGINLFDSWLYDDAKPFSYLRQLQVFEELKKKADEGFFEELIRKYLLNNTHAAVVVLEPKRGLQAETEAKTAEKLASYKSSLSEEEINRIIEETKALKDYQGSQDKPEDLEKIPLLKRSDLQRKTPVVFSNIVSKAGDTTIVRHDFDTNGISYLSLLFDTEHVPGELVPYMGILKSCLAFVSTEHYSYAELFHEINARTGGIACGLQLLQTPDEKEVSNRNADIPHRMFGIKTKYLYPEKNFVFDMIREIIFTSRLDDTKRLKEILASAKAGLSVSLASAGHSTAVQRSFSYQNADSAWQDATNGITFFRLIEDLNKNFDEKKDDLINKLQTLMRLIFRPENLLVSITSEEAGMEGVTESIEALKKKLYTTEVETGTFGWKKEEKQEAFRTPGQVQYVAKSGNFREAGFDYSGALQVLHVMLNYDYLWINLRVKGGAYGCMSYFRRNGDAALVSYRDPNLKETLDIYNGLPEYLENFDASEREMTKYIIGTFSEIDTPMNASAKGALSLNAWSAGRTIEQVQKERNQILDAKAEDIRALAPLAKALAEQKNICVIGSESKIEEEKELFSSVEPLVR